MPIEISEETYEKFMSKDEGLANDGLGEIMETNTGQLIALAEYTGVEPGYAEDIVSQVMFEIWNYRDRITDIKHLKSLLYIKTKSRVIDNWRSENARRERTKRWALENPDLVAEFENMDSYDQYHGYLED